MQNLIAKLAEIIGDYEHFPIGDVGEHIEQWIVQFPENVREELLEELVHVFNQHYISRNDWQDFLRAVLQSDTIIDGDPNSFWRETSFLDIQDRGNSQIEMLEALEELLYELYGIDINNCDGEGDQRFLYIDDGIFSGSRVQNDLRKWLTERADDLRGQTIKIIVVVAVAHNLADYFIKKTLEELENELGLDIEYKALACHWLNNQKSRRSTSDVLWPNELPEDDYVKCYFDSLGGEDKVILRTGNHVGDKNIFSSPEKRKLVEQELLKASVMVRNDSGHFRPGHKPLGYTNLPSLGFGSTIVTYRNCPNNCPLALWAGTSNWMALFPRKNN